MEHQSCMGLQWWSVLRVLSRQQQYSISNLIILKCMDLVEFELFARNGGHIVIFLMQKCTRGDSSLLFFIHFEKDNRCT